MNLAAGDGPFEIELADVNADGFEDLVTTDNGFINRGDKVSVRRHNGQVGAGAAFLAPTFTTLPLLLQGPTGLEVKDMNGDGLADLIVTGQTFRNMGIAFNTGGGTFSTPTQIYNLNFGGSFTSSAIAAGDYDHDGDIDVSSSSQGSLLIWRNDGAGNLSGGLGGEAYPFASPDPLADGTVFSASNAYRQRAIDVNQDGWLDLLTANSNGRASESWNLVLNNGKGGFLDPVAYHCSQNTHDCNAADIDGDGDLDVLTIAQFSNSLTVHRNLGNEAYQAINDPATIDPLSERIASADIDQDGDIDAVAIGLNASILRNDGTGAFSPVEFYDTPIDGKEVVLADLNDDGYPDLVIGPDEDSAPYFLGVSLNNGAGAFLPGTIVEPTPGGACGTGSLAYADFDGDGDIDIALTEEQSCNGDPTRNLFGFRNNGAGAFAPYIIDDNLLGRGLEVGDFNNDGVVDLIVNAVVVNSSFAVYLGNGDGTFQIGPVISPASVSDTFGIFGVADFNLDGNLDAATMPTIPSVGTNTFGVFLGNGDGSFQVSPVNIVAGSSTLEALSIGVDGEAIDVDHDGDHDLVITNYASNDYTVLINDGAGSLSSNGRYGANLQPISTTVNDFDGDGTADLATIVTTPNIASGVIVVQGVANLNQCPADFNDDTLLDFFDIAAFLDAFSNELPSADFVADGEFNFFDVAAYLDAFSSGCP
jgi:hypothetical protein